MECAACSGAAEVGPILLLLLSGEYQEQVVNDYDDSPKRYEAFCRVALSRPCFSRKLKVNKLLYFGLRRVLRFYLLVDL